MEQDILEFCRKRNIEIHIRHYLVKDCIRIRLRKGDKITEKIIPRHDGKISEIETDLEIAVRSMADELEEHKRGEQKVNLKDFKPGQTVYALSTKRGREINHTIRKYIVMSVGRKYVKVATEDHPTLTIAFSGSNILADNYLVENKDWGDRMKLFPSLQAANDEIEREALKDWLREAVNYNKIRLYSIEQLRAVRDILGGKNNGEEKEV